MRVRQDVGHVHWLAQISRRAAGTDLWANIYAVGRDSIGIRQLWSRGESKPQAVLIEQVNRAQQSFRVSFDEESDTVENVVERRIGENHFEGIEHPLTVHSLRSSRACSRSLTQ